jgi:hypothetical protein
LAASFVPDAASVSFSAPAPCRSRAEQLPGDGGDDRPHGGDDLNTEKTRRGGGNRHHADDQRRGGEHDDDGGAKAGNTLFTYVTPAPTVMITGTNPSGAAKMSFMAQDLL